jgi:dimethylglycine dehydrogenase
MRLVASGDVDQGSMPFMSVREMDVGIAPCLVARLSFTGELGYEIYLPSAYARSLYDQLLEAGAKFGIRPFGIRALLSLGMEKSFGIWSREFSPDYTPAMCGFDRFIDYGKADFIGREAALADRETTPEHRLVTLEIDSDDADAWGYEPVWHKDELAGFVTSGAYGHTVGKSLAMAYLKTPFLESGGNEFSVHVVDQRRPATVLPEAAYDPSGSRMRS